MFISGARVHPGPSRGVSDDGWAELDFESLADANRFVSGGVSGEPGLFCWYAIGSGFVNFDSYCDRLLYLIYIYCILIHSFLGYLKGGSRFTPEFCGGDRSHP